MLGMTTPDAIAFGMMLLAVIAALKGLNQGEAAKKQQIAAASYVSIAGGVVDANQFADYMKAFDKMAIALNRHADALDRQHEIKHTNALEKLAQKVDRALEAGHERDPGSYPGKPPRRR